MRVQCAERGPRARVPQLDRLLVVFAPGGNHTLKNINIINISKNILVRNLTLPVTVICERNLTVPVSLHNV